MGTRSTPIKAPYATMMALLVAACAFSACEPQTPTAEQSKRRSPASSPKRMVLVDRPVGAGNSLTQLALWRQRIDLPRLTLRDWTAFSRKHGTNGFPNVAFLVVVRSPGKPGKADVAGLIYRRNEPGIVPPTTWCADVACSNRGDATYVALGGATPEKLDLALYQVDLLKRIGRWPLELKHDTWRQWPSPLPVLTRARWRIQGESLPRVSDLSARLQTNAITIDATVGPKVAAGVQFHYDLARERWSAEAPEGTRVVLER